MHGYDRRMRENLRRRHTKPVSRHQRGRVNGETEEAATMVKTQPLRSKQKWNLTTLS